MLLPAHRLQSAQRQVVDQVVFWTLKVAGVSRTPTVEATVVPPRDVPMEESAPAPEGRATRSLSPSSRTPGRKQWLTQRPLPREGRSSHRRKAWLNRARRRTAEGAAPTRDVAPQGCEPTGPAHRRPGGRKAAVSGTAVPHRFHSGLALGKNHETQKSR